MKKTVCSVCSYTYDEAKGIPEAGIAPDTAWENLPEDWKCPVCGAGKDAFKESAPTAGATETGGGSAEGKRVRRAAETAEAKAADERRLTAAEMSVVCSNLAKGCEKQYLAKQAEEFGRLAEFFASRTDKPKPDVGKLASLIERELSSCYPEAHAAASRQGDRGALRALVWSEKVTRMLQSLLARYRKEGEKMLADTGVYVCTICGFVYVGDAPPEICPVCKVPGWKFEKIARRA